MSTLRISLLFFTCLLLVACSNSSDIETEVNNVKNWLVASEKNLPTNFNEIALERKEFPHFQYLVSRVYDQAQFKEAWNFFGFNEQIPKVHFEESVLLFIGLHESGSCPYDLEKINTTIESKEMTIFLSEPGGDCTADATPRSFVIELDKESSNHIKNVVIVQSGVETTVPIIDRK